VSQPIRAFMPSAKARRSISCTTRQPGEADRFDVERRWLAAQAPVSIRDQI
jgi:hypothetical protein